VISNVFDNTPKPSSLNSESVSARVPALDSVSVPAERPICTDAEIMKAAIKSGDVDYAFEIARARYQELHALHPQRPEKIVRQADLLRMMSATGRWIESGLNVIRDAETMLAVPNYELNAYSRYLMASLMEFRLSGRDHKRSGDFSAEALFKRLQAVQNADSLVEPFFQYRQATLLKAACVLRQSRSLPVEETAETVRFALDSYQRIAPRNAFTLASLYHYIGGNFESAERYASLAKRCPEQMPSDPFAAAELEARSVYHQDPERAEVLFLELLSKSQKQLAPWDGESRTRIFLAGCYQQRGSFRVVDSLLDDVQQPPSGEAGFLLEKLKDSAVSW
jgi:hypothetical protein